MKSSLKLCLLFCLLFLSACSKSEDKAMSPMESASPTQEQQTAYDVVRLFYGTDRAPSGSSDPGEYYGNERDKIQLGMCEVSIPENHQIGELEKPSLWKLEFRENPEKHVVLLDVNPMQGNHFLKQLQSDVNESEGKEAFIFIHGFNVTFEDAARRTAQIAHDLKFKGAPIMYSWPSKGSVTQYVEDGETVKWSEAHVATFIEAVAQRSGAKRIHLIAHSMGNRLLTRAVGKIVNSPSSETVPQFNQIILTAPDIDANVFRNQIAPRITQAAGRVTIYASSNDKALMASQTVNGGPRLGQGGQYLQQFPGLNKIEVIDASDIDTSLFGMGHSYFSDKPTILHDISKVLKGVSVSQRNLLSVKQGAWEIKPDQYADNTSRTFR